MTKHTPYGSGHPVARHAHGAHRALHATPGPGADPGSTVAGHHGAVAAPDRAPDPLPDRAYDLAVQTASDAGQPPVPGPVSGAAGHGGYLVAFPEALGQAPPEVPRIWPVAAWTVSLGLPGLMVAVSGPWFGMLSLLLVPAGLLLLGPGVASARRRARKAPAAAPYWVAFTVAATAAGLLAVAVLAAAVPGYLQVRESATVLALQENIVEDGQLASATGLTAVQVDCRAAGERGADDRRSYSCVTTLNDGRTGFINVRADSRGNWSLAPTP